MIEIAEHLINQNARLIAERDRAREIAVGLEQQLARVADLADEWENITSILTGDRAQLLGDVAVDLRAALGGDL